MGGGKSRALCELVLDLCLDFPGIRIPVCRQSHVSLLDTTKKTMLEQVLPAAMVEHSKASGGEDYLRLRNGSWIGWYGLDDPGRLFSSEYGFAVVDEAHQVAEESVVLLNTRLRQRCPACVSGHVRDCGHFPCGLALGFNPEHPGHWLYRWMVEGGSPFKLPGSESSSPDGFVKAGVFPRDSISSIGSGEFVVAKATDNFYNAARYVEENLGGLPELLRRRYLGGEWLYVSGAAFFDLDALGWHQERLVLPVRVCRSEGGLSGADKKDRVRFSPVGRGGVGPWWVWQPPVRERLDEKEERTLPAHRYVVSVDVSSGTSNDYSAIQVVDVEAFAQVAEFQGLLDMDLLAVEAFRAAVVYNGAVVAPEVTGGWGQAVASALEKLLLGWRGPAGSKPRLFVRRVEDRLKKIWTDRIGWDTTVKSRAEMFTTLERVIREREFVLRSQRCHAELSAFVWPERRSGAEYQGSSAYAGVPAAQPGANDDLVVALAMGVHLASRMPRELRPVREERYLPQVASTGY